MLLHPDAQSRLDALGDNDLWPFGTGARLKDFLAPEPKEPPLADVDEATCGTCTHADEEFLWSDENWLLGPCFESAFPGAVMLYPRSHVQDFTQLTEGELATFGSVLARAEKAVQGIGQPGTPTAKLARVGRVHVSRWGDGGYHLHVWLIPRPLGGLQLRGFFLTMWMMFLQPARLEDRQAAHRQIAAAMAAGGAISHG